MSEHPAALAARQLVAALVSQGVRDVVLAPGSRSAPLAYALAAAEQAGWVRVHVRIDERVAGFVALGIARSRPCAVVVTSGTAVANLHPAVLEARHGRHPVIVISADRPQELRGVGASQTTDQVGIFGTSVRYDVDIPAGANPTAAVVRAVAAAVGRGARPGPVHLNVGFRDPLTPAAPWQPGPMPTGTRVMGMRAETESAGIAGGNVVVVAGDGAGQAAVDLADSGRWPLLAEPSSGARRGSTAIAAYHAALAELGGEIERVVVYGHPTLSRDITRLLARTDVEIIVIDDGDWTDVAGTAAVVASRAHAVDPGSEDWLARWQGYDVEAPAPTLGGQVLRAVLSGAGPTVLLGSSMTVRYADRHAPAGAGFTTALVLANRGLAGIDGTMSTATGVALATGGPVRVVVGDLTFLHDIGGLLRGVQESEVDVQVIVLDDTGGGIFATLEHGRPEFADVYPRFFGAAQRADIAALAAGVGAAHQQLTGLDSVVAALARPIVGRSVVQIPLT